MNTTRALTNLPQVPAGRTSRQLGRVGLAAALVLTVVVRVIYLLRDNTLSADEAVTGIMARQMAAGSHFYLFFAGQNYNSAVEQYPQALLFALGAPQTAFVLRTVQIVLNVVSCWLIYLIGGRLFDDRWRPVLAALLFAVGPIFQIARGSTTTGSYTAQLMLCLLTLWCALSLISMRTRWSQWLAAIVIGFATTGTFYLSASGYFVLLPVFLYALPGLLRLRLLWPAVAAAAVGAAPNLLWAIHHDTSIVPSVGVIKSTMTGRIKALLDTVGREFFGLAHANGVPGVPLGWARLIVWLGFAALFIAVAVRWRSILALLLCRIQGRRPLDVVIVAGVLGSFLFVISKYAGLLLDPRYLYVSNVTLVLLLAALASPAAIRTLLRWLAPTTPTSVASPAGTEGPVVAEIMVVAQSPVVSAVEADSSSRWRRLEERAVKAFTPITVFTAVVSAALLLLIGVPTVVMLSHQAVDSNGNTRAGPSSGPDGDYRSIVAALSSEGSPYLYATYWDAVPIEFLANEAITAATYGRSSRFPDQYARVTAAPYQQIAYLERTVIDGKVIPSNVGKALTLHLVSYRKRQFGDLTLYDHLSKDIRPSDLSLSGP